MSRVVVNCVTGLRDGDGGDGWFFCAENSIESVCSVKMLVKQLDSVGRTYDELSPRTVDCLGIFCVFDKRGVMGLGL